MSWFKKVGNSIWNATKKATSTITNVIKSDAVQAVAGMVGLGGVATVAEKVATSANEAVNKPTKSVVQPVVEVVESKPVIQTVASVVEKPVQAVSTVQETVRKEVAVAESNVSVQAEKKDYMPMLLAGGFGLGLLAVMRK
ncbi:hypothetical protein [uncultured Sphaerochaeta sp.]|uniref:hypothetical protein n=1 Tax=uncultured Sphaerochaeta sp. TaxID=886478 RepID=UPI0029CA864F|nr:hypothetical protein [uncultured Sphaerochaeta sp.]